MLLQRGKKKKWFNKLDISESYITEFTSDISLPTKICYNSSFNGRLYMWISERESRDDRPIRKAKK